MAWRANDFAIVANGGTAALDTSGALPVAPVRLLRRHQPGCLLPPPTAAAGPGVGMVPSPNNQQDGATADLLRAICDIDLAEFQEIEPPRGFGRD